MHLNAFEWNLLHTAAYNGNIKLVKFLPHKGKITHIFKIYKCAYFEFLTIFEKLKKPPQSIGVIEIYEYMKAYTVKF